ncbi:3025_t:CDS:2, partial [Ambispora gerdemannii]
NYTTRSIIAHIQKKKKMDYIDFIFLVIPTGAFFGYRSTPYEIYISKNESVSVLHTKVRNILLHEYRNASFNLRAVDVELREYVHMEPEKKISDYLDKVPAEISFHFLVESESHLL